ncbi:unnamed protein product [Rotaria sordida]|uniref:Uncharacterized protein n=1 Tax=Rotaria sordida TaxID=392033 RepID=A0A813SX09_9BILA|nr:unnamed protein product [Rotaria sordida]
MAQALPSSQNELENRSQLHTTTVTHIQTTRNNNGSNQAEPTEDQRPFGYGPCRKCFIDWLNFWHNRRDSPAERESEPMKYQ